MRLGTLRYLYELEHADKANPFTLRGAHGDEQEPAPSSRQFAGTFADQNLFIRRVFSQSIKNFHAPPPQWGNWI